MSQDFPYDLPRMGIYSVTCTVTGEVYVGQSRRLRSRWCDHLKGLRAGRGCLQFEVLEAVSDPGVLSQREQHFIDLFKAASEGLNTLPTAGSFRGYTPEQRETITGRQHSEETLQKMSKARKGVPWLQARRDAQTKRQAQKRASA